MNYLERLQEGARNRTLRIGVIGLGYVGLPLATVFAEAGFHVVGFDVDTRKIDALRRAESYIDDIASERLVPLVREGLLEVSSDPQALARCDSVTICVPTPLGKAIDPDISYIIKATESIVQAWHPGMLVVLESTTYPGTTTDVVLPMIEAHPSHPQVGKDFFLCFSPERVDPGRTDWTVRNTPKVMGGVTPTCSEAGTAVYGAALDRLVPVSSPATAEMVKLLENTFRAVNIALVNEVLLLCDRLGIDAWEVIDAAATKPFGFMKFTPGPGYGGHCIPIDPLYLAWKMRTLDNTARFIELATEINREMPRFWVEKVYDALNSQGKALSKSTILLLGVAYKKDVSDMRKSPAVDILRLLHTKQTTVLYHDPHVPSFDEEGVRMSSEHNLNEALERADCVIIVTDHSSYDWAEIQRKAKLIVDTRHVLSR